MLYQLVQAGFWLSLSVWFGGAVFVALAARAVFGVLQRENPVLPQVLAVNLEGQHGVLLGSSIMASLLRTMGRAQMVCAAVTILVILSHFVIADTSGDNRTAAFLRLGLAVAGGGLLGYDQLVVLPRLAKQRQTYIDHADEPEVANPAKDAFDKDQQLNLTLLMLTVCVLAGLVLFSASITPAPVVTPLGGGK